jgi:hypothetical protein
MTTITLNINEKSKMGKAFLNFLKTFNAENDDIQLAKPSDIPYNKNFVDKIQKARKQIKEGKTIPVETESLWESIKYN